jgi:hypothetical protein
MKLSIRNSIGSRYRIQSKCPDRDPGKIATPLDPDPQHGGAASFLLGMHRISGRIIRPFFDIRYPAGYQIGQPDIR